MGKIIVYGGAFNPPHNLHLVLAKQIINKYNDVEKIIFMPVNSKYKKSERIISNEHRYNMLKLVCNENEKFEVSRLELDSNRPLYTIETLFKLKEIYQNKEIIFMTGTDNLKEFETWHEAQKIVENFKVLVLERDEDNMENIINENEFLIKNKDSFIKLDCNVRSNLSSTIIRKKIRDGESIINLVPKIICKYIEENNLYEEI